MWAVPLVFASQFMMIQPAYADGFGAAPPGFETFAPVMTGGFLQDIIELNKSAIIFVE